MSRLHPAALCSLLLPLLATAAPNPYAAEEPELVLTQANYREHAAQLSAGHLALFARYPDYRMVVYPAHHSVHYPKAILEAGAQNRARARLLGADALEGAQLGIPFPEPRSGVEVMWNHRLRYRGDSARWRYHRVCVTDPQHPQVGEAREWMLAGYANLTGATAGMHSWNLLHMAPAEEYTDYTAVWHDGMNPTKQPRRIWGGSSASRTYRAPPLGYDEVGLFSYHIRYFDMVDMYNGAFDRYTWKLLGKQDRYVPYDSYRVNDGTHTAASLVKQRFVDPDALRYELRRVWIVEATLRPGAGHPLAKRVFYVDEDTWSVLLADGYGANGQLSRFQEGHLLPILDGQAADYAPVVTYDLPGERWYADRLVGTFPAPRFNVKNLQPSDFNPEATRGTNFDS